MLFLEKTKTASLFKRFDYMLLTAVLGLSALGLVVLKSATLTMPGGGRILAVQTISVIIGVVLALIISLIDVDIYKSFALPIFILSILMLAVVLKFGFGMEEFGSNSWLMLPVINMSFQPSEIAKIAFIITVSLLLENIKEKKGRYNYLKLLVCAALTIGLVVLQRDYGTAVVFIFIFATILFIWGIKYRYILISAMIGAMAAPLVWTFVLNDERKERILEFLFPGSDPSGASYQVAKAKMAIGSGGIFGSGLGQGIQTQNPVGGIPVKESDCIFAVIGEELGFIGTALVLLLVFVILLRCIYIARNSADKFSSYVTMGITGMFAFHFFENIGMNLGVLPVTGVPLPFVSQGGTAMISNYIAIGIVLSISLRRQRKHHPY
ncbi:MAG: FtsW/RodA/SpoVE family cell cycle protein [Eubacteriales bacterium]|nr:FtsW/RodA/SpoVE family cell cycle protein [Eubacteriales bacterium]